MKRQLEEVAEKIALKFSYPHRQASNQQVFVSAETFRTGEIREPMYVDSLNNHMVVNVHIVIKDPIEKSLPWLNSFYDLNDEEVGPQEIRTLFQHLDKEIRDENFEKINEMFSDINTLQLCLKLKSAAVRYAGPVKGRLPLWSKALVDLRNDLYVAKADVDGILFGLI